MTNNAPFRVEFRTERMHFEPLTPADGGDFLEIANDPVVAEAVSFLHYPVRAEDIDKLIQGNDAHNCLLGGRLLVAGDLAAVVGMHRHDSGEIEIGYLVRSDRHGEGLATEAAKGLIAALARRYPEAVIAAECQPEHLKSWHILENLGFKSTGKFGKREGRVKLQLTSPAG